MRPRAEGDRIRDAENLEKLSAEPMFPRTSLRCLLLSEGAGKGFILIEKAAEIRKRVN